MIFLKMRMSKKTDILWKSNYKLIKTQTDCIHKDRDNNNAYYYKKRYGTVILTLTGWM